MSPYMESQSILNIGSLVAIYIQFVGVAIDG